MPHAPDSRILLVGSYPPPHGGQAVHVQKLLEYLPQHGYDASVINTGVDKSIASGHVRSVSSSRQLLRLLLIGRAPTLVHVHVSNPDEFGKLLPVYCAARVRRFKSVATIHSGNVDRMLEGLRGVRRRVTGHILRHLDAVICVNEHTAARMSAWERLQRIAVIPAFSMDAVNATPDARSEAHLRTYHPVISCVGFFREIYGFDLAIRAVERLRSQFANIGLILMGDPAGSSPYVEQITEANLGDRVLLRGNVDHDECLAIISRSTLFLRPTLYDGDSISVREAQALGVPVVASDTEFRPDGVTLFRKGDVDDLVEKLSSTLGAAVTATQPSAGRAAGHRGNLDAVRAVYEELLR